MPCLVIRNWVRVKMGFFVADFLEVTESSYMVFGDARGGGRVRFIYSARRQENWV